MIRIKDEELCTIDVEWYGIDKKGNVAVFCSAGEANVPEFVCVDKKRYEELVYLFDKLPVVSDTLICFKPCKKNHLHIEVAETYSNKGIYYYDADDNSKSEKNICVCQEYYTINSKPLSPIKYSDLPIKIQELLKDNFLDIDDFENEPVIKIKNAY
jgi:hypothetical protein